MMKFIYLLQKPPSLRSQEDIDALFSFLHSHNAFSCVSEASLRLICQSIRYERHPANSLLFRRQEVIGAWFVLLSGSVFIDGRMFVADDVFGKRRPGELLRTSDCIVSEPSEMMVVDYLGGSTIESDQLNRDCTDTDGKHRFHATYAQDFGLLPHLYSQNRQLCYSDSSLFDQGFENAVGSGMLRHSDRSMDHRYTFYNGSKTSDTSSLYSGSDVMLSSTDDQPIDLNGLIESIVDSDDDDDEENYSEQSEYLSLHDAFHECLDKSPEERTEKDIELILESIQHLPAFNNMTLATRRALCAVMRYAAIDAMDRVVMTDGEQVDSWSVILNGEVETVHPDGSVKLLRQGESFGLATPTRDKVYHEGIMHTKIDNCQFLFITQDDYCRVMQEGEDNIECIKENNKVILVTEERIVDDRKARVVIRGTPEKLLKHLMSASLSSVDPMYTEDFLLTYRTFFKSPLDIAKQLLEWFKHPSYREQVVSIVLEWMNSHYCDFEAESEMFEFLEQLETGLKEQNLTAQLKLLNLTFAAKAKPRTVILNRVERKEILHFSIVGGLERGCGIFINKVEKGSKAHEIGLKRGDQILDVNNQNFERISHNRALEILRGSTHLSITVKCNMLGFNEMLHTPSNSGSRKESRSRKQPLSQLLSEPNSRFSTFGSKPVIRGGKEKSVSKEEERTSSSSFLPPGNKNKLLQALSKLNILGIGLNSDVSSSQSGGFCKGSSSGGNSPLIRTRFSSSHPDLSTLKLCTNDNDLITMFPDHVLKIFQDDQSFKYLMVFKETTAREVVMLSLQEFGMTTPASSNYSLCEVVLEEGFVKQRRLPDQLSNLADRCSLNSRYYLKCNEKTDPLIPDDIIGDVIRECQTNFLILDCAETAAQLTIKDFHIFRNVRPTEYIIDLFNCPSQYGTPNLTKFSQLSNSEMFWVVTQICSESNLSRRVKTLKHFIQMAKHCQECKNYNSLFAIISGLGHGSVQRLKQTWDKLPSKYLHLFEDLQKLMDPTRNMSRYRNLISSESSHPPLIPFFPLVKKDLTFIHLGNDSVVDGLVNFEKLRMIAKEVRHVCSMAPAHIDINMSISASAAALMRKKTNSTLQSNPRKLYEETQMVRRVRAYLSSYKVIEDENMLADMSNHCESPVAFNLLVRRPDSSGSSNSNPVILTKQTAINTGPKFGADSPDAVHKLMQLTDRVRPLENRRHRQYPIIPSSTGGNCFAHGQQVSANAPVVLLSPESSSVLGPTRQREHRSSLCKDTEGWGSVSNSPSSSVGSNAGKRILQNTSGNRLKLSESDSGHNSSSNCDSNSTSSVGSTGSTTTKASKSRPRVSSMRQISQPYGGPLGSGGSMQQSRSIFYVNSVSDLQSESSKETVRTAMHVLPNVQLAENETLPSSSSSTLRRTSSSPVRTESRTSRNTGKEVGSVAVDKKEETEEKAAISSV